MEMPEIEILAPADLRVGQEMIAWPGEAAKKTASSSAVARSIGTVLSR